jgi:hypothetical protein
MRNVRLLGLFALLAGVHVALAADVKVPAEVKVAPGRLARIVVETKGKTVEYVNVYDNADIFREYDPAAFVFRFLADAPGCYKVGFYAPDASPSPAAYCWVVVGDAPPPVPPGPTPPGPVPPGPGPAPSGGLTVLVVYDAGKVGTLTEAQQNVLYSKRVRDWLDAHTPAGPDGKTHNWRIFDQGVDASADPGPWKALLARPRAAVPALVVADGKDPSKVLYEGPLPADADKALELLKKYAKD